MINTARFYKDDGYDLEYIRDHLFPIYFNKFTKEKKEKYIMDPAVNQYIYGYAYGQSLDTLGNDYPVKIKQYEPLYKNKNYPMIFNNIDEFNKWLEDNNYCILPNGSIFDQNKDNAIISKVIADIMNKRTEYKNMMKECLKQSNKAKDEGNKELSIEYKEQADVYDMNQKAVKTINNGCYGCCSSKYFRLFSIDVAEAFTTTGQVIIRNTIDIANRKLNELSNTSGKDYVLTTDTDSIIFTMENIINDKISEKRKSRLEEIAKIPVLVQTEVNTKIKRIAKDILKKSNINDDNNYLNIKNEWVGSSGFFVSKKHYVFNQVYKEGIPFQSLNIVGLECKKSSTPNKIKPILFDIIMNILTFEDKDKVDQLVIDAIDKINKFDIQDIALPQGVKDLDSYDGIPINVRASRIWNDFYARSETDKITNGKIKFIYVKKFDIPELNRVKHYVKIPDFKDDKDGSKERAWYAKHIWSDKLRCWCEPNSNEYVIAIDGDKSKWEYIKDKIEVDYDIMKKRLILSSVNSYYKAIGWTMPIQAISNNNGAFDMFL